MDSGWVNFLQLGVWLDLGLVLDEVVRRRCAGLKVSKSAYYLPISPLLLLLLLLLPSH